MNKEYLMRSFGTTALAEEWINKQYTCGYELYDIHTSINNNYQVLVVATMKKCPEAPEAKVINE